MFKNAVVFVFKREFSCIERIFFVLSNNHKSRGKAKADKPYSLTEK